MKDRDEGTRDESVADEETTGEESSAQGPALEKKTAKADEDAGTEAEAAGEDGEAEDEAEAEAAGEDGEAEAAAEDGDGDDDAETETEAEDEPRAAKKAEPRAAKKAEPREEPAQDRTRLMMVAAVLIGVAAVAGLWWSERGGGDDDPDIAAAEDDGTLSVDRPPEEGALDQLGQGALGQGAGPQQPQPIPAPPDVAAPPEDAERSESGLAWRVLQEGTGSEHPSESDLVTLNYTGWTTQGQMVDSSEMRGEPAKIPLNRAVDGWIEGVQLMVKGEKRRFWVPPQLADTGRGQPPGPIVFDMELLDFEAAPEPPPAPRNVSGPPANAERTESGLAYQVLQEGQGEEHPTANSQVRVHFTGWTTDGEMLDTSVTLGEAATLPPLQRVLPGMREGIQQMVVGEKRRLWIPEELAFGGRPGAPEGMIVFDIELVEIAQAPPGMPGMPGMPSQGGRPQGHPPPQGHPSPQGMPPRSSPRGGPPG